MESNEAKIVESPTKNETENVTDNVTENVTAEVPDHSPIKTPRLCTDVIIEVGAGLIVLIERKNAPYGWALPGGFVDVGEMVEEAAIREALEETSLNVELIRQFHVYSNPKRDERGHSASVTFVATARGEPKAGSDAKNVGLFHQMNLPENICFDHREIIKDYFYERY
ncbi:NUDIX hydrolase [bacterium]|nr:NUDIX hydrolase [bacterium]